MAKMTDLATGATRNRAKMAKMRDFGADRTDFIPNFTEQNH